jgi:hypothetical protein
MQARSSRSSVVSAVAFAALLALPAAATANEPTILQASVSGNTLTIQGTYLGSNRPTVQLGGGAPLAVTSFSQTVVVAAMPSAGLPPGTYQLLFTRANGANTTFVVSVPAVPACSGRPGGTCSATASHVCAYDKDCPAGETCLDPTPRFVQGNGTVKDMRTCLEWEKKTSTIGATTACWPGPPEPCAQSADFHNVNNVYGFPTDRIDPLMLGGFLANLNIPPGFAGHTDWRLPTSGGAASDPSGSDPELESILLAPYPCATSPCIDTTVFGPTASFSYWSVTPASWNSSNVRIVNFDNGGLGEVHIWNANPVRAVRGSPGAP